MKIKLNREDRDKILIAYNNFIFNHMGLRKYLLELYAKFSTVIYGNSGNILEIVNDFYLDKEKYDIYSTISSLDELDKFVESYYKEILVTNMDLNSKYIVQLDDSDALLENAVENGALVFKVNVIMDYNKMNYKEMKIVVELDNYIKKLGKELSSIVGIPVHVLSSKRVIGRR